MPISTALARVAAGCRMRFLVATPIILGSALGGCATDDSGGGPPIIDSTPRMISTVDSNSCQVWDPKPNVLGVSPSWSGQCNTFAEGQGTLTFYGFSNGAVDNTRLVLRETGTMTDGKLNGPASVTFYAGNISINNADPTGEAAMLTDFSYEGNLTFEDGMLNGPGGITLSPPQAPQVIKEGNFLGDPTNPNLDGSCEEFIVENGQKKPIMLGKCSDGNLVDGNETSYDQNGIKQETLDGTFGQNGAVLVAFGKITLMGLTNGIRKIYDSDGSTVLEKDVGTFLNADDDVLQSGSSTFYNEDGSVQSIQEGQTNGTFLDGPGSYAASDGKLLQGTWSMGCFDGKYPQAGISSCSEAAADVQTAENNAAQTQAYQAQQAQILQDELNADQEQDREDLQQISDTISQGVQNISAQVLNMQSVHNQVQQEIAARNQPVEAPSGPAKAPIAPNPDQQVASNSAPTGTPANSCVANFYNSHLYGWFNWKDTCSYPITIVAELRKSPGDEGGLSTVYPESSDVSNGSTGLSADEVNQGGGFVYAACPQGFIPYDTATNQLYGNKSSSFYCKQGYVP